MKSIAVVAALIVIAAAARDQPAVPRQRIVDLSHAYGPSTVYWPTSPTKFTLETLASGRTEAGYFYAANSLCTPEHGGTHLDAPRHFAESGQTTDQIPLDRLIAPAVVLDVSAQAAANRDYTLTPEDVRQFEQATGAIAPGTIVLLRTPKRTSATIRRGTRPSCPSRRSARTRRSCWSKTAAWLRSASTRRRSTTGGRRTSGSIASLPPETSPASKT